MTTTCKCPRTADDNDDRLCGKPACGVRVVEGLAFDMCAECLKKYDADVIERAREEGFEWRENTAGAEVVANGLIVVAGTRPACIEWLAAILPDDVDLEADESAN